MQRPASPMDPSGAGWEMESDSGTRRRGSRRQLFTDTDSETSRIGLWNQLRRRCWRKFGVTVRQDVICNERLVATLGGKYCFQTHKGKLIAHMKYKIDEKKTLKLGYNEIKLKDRWTFNIKDCTFGCTPSIYARLDDGIYFGATLKPDCLQWPCVLLGMLAGQNVNKKVKVNVVQQAEGNFGVGMNLKVRGRQYGYFPDAAIKETNVVFDFPRRGQSLLYHSSDPSSPLPDILEGHKSSSDVSEEDEEKYSSYEISVKK